jgi:hypothetical protein
MSSSCTSPTLLEKVSRSTANGKSSSERGDSGGGALYWPVEPGTCAGLRLDAGAQSQEGWGGHAGPHRGISGASGSAPACASKLSP